MIKNDRCLIIFSDLIGSSEVADELTPEEYANNYIKSFYFAGKLALNFIKKVNPKWKTDIEYDFSGDEILIFKKIDYINGCSNDVVTALSFAYTLKLYWLLSHYTVNKIMNKKPPREIACGLHIGDVVLVKPSNGRSCSPRYASYAINIAKRVETTSRKGVSSNIYATNIIGEIFNKWKKQEIKKSIENLRLLICTAFKSAMPELLKGISGKVWISELVPKFKCSEDKDLFEILKVIKGENEYHAYEAHKMLSKCINMFFNRNANNEWAFSPHPLKVSKDKKINYSRYLRNLIYLSKCSANLWFKFNTFYIASGLVAFAKTQKITISNFSKDINEIYEDLKERCELQED